MATAFDLHINDFIEPAFVPADIQVKPVSEAWERQSYFALRKRVFSQEQQLLLRDRDTHDFQAIGIVAIANICGMADQVVGAVRIYQAEAGLWYGGRLCVAPAYRHHHDIGKALINEAVARAIDLGCMRFLATVQVSNEHYFQQLHWQTLEQITLLGRPHCLMQAELTHYPFMPRGFTPPLHVSHHHAS